MKCTVKKDLAKDLVVAKNSLVKTEEAALTLEYPLSVSQRSAVSIFLVPLERMRHTRTNELKIIEDYLALLCRVTPTNYWVLNISSSEQLDSIIKERKRVVELYKEFLTELEKLHDEGVEVIHTGV